MSDGYETIDGFRCFAPHVAREGADYPLDGFDVTAQVEMRSFWCRSRNRIVRNLFQRFTDSSKRLNVLEIGCGIGGVLQELCHLPNLRLTGSEIYLQGLRYARAKLPDIEFIQLDATDIPFRDEFDVICAFDVLEHIGADELVITQVHKALHSGGLFFVTVPQHPWMWSRLDEAVHHKRRYSRDELIQKLTSGGFRVEYASSFVTFLFPFMIASRLMDRFRDPANDSAAGIERYVDLPSPINLSFDWFMRLDEAVLRADISLPFGGSLLAVARR
jgi:SAM-dependent methyltransferase